jgi:hypothetical protein
MKNNAGGRTLVLFLLALMFLLLTASSAGAVSVNWTRILKAPAGRNCILHRNALDDSGNLYVIGKVDISSGSDINPSDIVLRKYSRTGRLLLHRRIDLNTYDVGYGIALDKDGNIYVSGDTGDSLTNTDIWVAKLNPAGHIVWQQTVNGSASGSDTGYSIAVKDGAVVAAGTIGNATSDGWLRKYNLAGKVLWTRTIAGKSGGFDTINDVTMSDQGRIYVGGAVQTSAGDLGFYARYTPAGRQVWRKQDPAYVRGIAEKAGYLYVVGWKNTGHNGDIWVRRVSANKSTIWTRTYGSDAKFDGASGVAVDKNGNAYVTGSMIVVPTPRAEISKAWTAKYNRAGKLVWQRKSVRRVGFAGEGIAVRGAANIYVSANYERPATDQSNGWIRKYGR